MLCADNILMPHSPEVLAARLKEKMDKFEAAYPGVAQKTREWMQTDDFRQAVTSMIHVQALIDLGWAPTELRVKMYEFGRVAKYDIWHKDFVGDIADLLWQEYHRA